MRRSAAINRLRGMGTFRHVSLRLLDDLLDTVGDRPLVDNDLETYIERAKQASFSLYWSLDLRFWEQSRLDGEPRSHAICLCSSAGRAVPLEALGHLLAYSITAQFDEPAAVLSFAGDGRMWLYHPKGFIGPKPLPAGAAPDAVIAAFPEVPARPFYHLIFVHPQPSKALALPQRFHRLVYVHGDQEISGVPLHLQSLLIDAVWGGDVSRIAPRFSSFIATQFLRDGDHPSQTRAWDIAANLIDLCHAGGLRTQPTGDAFDDGRLPAAWRLRRDSCRVAMDLAIIARAWHERSKPGGGREPFARMFLGANPQCLESAFHWARAVTNRQVGLALNGGGASSYRMIPLIRRLHHELGVPIDVVCGAGGGALLGAYYCAEGLEGLDKMIAEGRALTAAGLAAVASSKVIELKLNFDLQGARLERFERRFVPLATVLSSGHSPEQRAVVAGTVGEAVRVAAAAPVSWGRTVRKRRHYVDAPMPIPARALMEHGADMIIACNCVPSPTDGNPLTTYLRTSSLAPAWLADRLVERTPLGRLSDALVALAFLTGQAARGMEHDAHVYVEPRTAPISMLESFAFFESSRLVGASERDMRRDNGPQRDLLRAAQTWEGFRRSPPRSS